VAAEGLEERIGYTFRNKDLLQRALTHRSWLEGRTQTEVVSQDNEQLEFLGDAILGFMVSDALVLTHPGAREGQLSRWKSHLVSAAHLHHCAVELELGRYLLLGRGEERGGGRARPTLLSDALEALIAAIYLDGGLEPARAFIDRIVMQLSLDLDERFEKNNQKVELQGAARALGLPAPSYRVLAEEGPDHAKVFLVEARVGENFVAQAKAGTKRMANLIAAKSLLEQLENMAAKTRSSLQISSGS
jgi:ribonuclease-3